MMKMFLGAVMSSGLVFTFMHKVLETKFHNIRNKRASGNAKRGLFGTVIGSSILGSGMTIAGACPGMVISQVGTSTPSALFTMGGGLLGAFVFGLVEPVMHKVFIVKGEKQAPVRLEKLVGLTYPEMSMIFSIMCAVILLGLESYISWKSEVPPETNPECIPLLTCDNISPVIGGILIGLLQVPAFLVMNSTLGSSSSYVSVSGVWVQLNSVLHGMFPYFAAKSNMAFSTWWQTIYIGSAIMGSMIASGVTPSTILTPSESIHGVSPLEGVIGGFLMVFGSRFAYGCTSGHGLSGLPLLMVHSLVAVAAMFGGAMLLGLIFSVKNPSMYYV